MQSGEIDVTGKDKIEINLGKCHPGRVIVRFEGNYHHVPCNPKHHDELRWEIKNKNSGVENTFALIISWDVTNVRTIEWVAYY